MPGPFRKETIVFSTKCALGQLNRHMQKNEVESLSHTTYIQINSKSVKDLNVKAKPIKLLKQG